MLLCGNCSINLLSIQYLCLYETATSKQLIYKPEISQDTLKTCVNISISKVEMAGYCICKQRIGRYMELGPGRAPAFCFSLSQVIIMARNGSINALKRDFKNLLEEYPQVKTRKLNTFFGQDPEQRNIEFHELQRPTLDLLQTLGTLQKLKERPRPYQVEMYVVASQGNTICYLPTGSGKTLIACMLTALMHSLNPKRKVLFLVNNIPLAFQQGEYLRIQTGLKVCSICSENGEGYSEALISNSVIVATVGFMLNLIDCNIFDIEEASLVVIDEVHHARKDHPFAMFLRLYSQKPQSKRPLLLGLSASPVFDRDSPSALCELFCGRIYTPIVYREQLNNVANRPLMQFVQVKKEEKLEVLEMLIKEYLNKVLAAFKEASVFDFKKSSYTQTISFLRNLVHSCHESSDSVLIRKALHLQLVFSLVEVCVVLGPSAALDDCKDIVEEEVRNGSFWTLQDIERMKELERLLQRDKGTSRKVQALMNILREAEHNSESRIIVFVKTRRTARRLQRKLYQDQELTNKWKPAVFVGKNKGCIDGMNWEEEQRPILKLYKKGRIQLLISTSVLNEGFDVPSCDKVILFDPLLSVVGMVQCRGRSRSMNSHFAVICTAQEQEAYKELRITEEIIKESVILMILNDLSILGWKEIRTMIALNIELEKLMLIKSADPLLPSLDGVDKVIVRLYNLKKEIDKKALGEIISNDFVIEDDTTLEFVGKKSAAVTLELLKSDILKVHGILEFFVDLKGRLPGTVLSWPRNAYSHCENLFHSSNAVHFGNIITPSLMHVAMTHRFSLKVEILFDQRLLQVFFKLGKGLYRIVFDFRSFEKFLLLEMLEESIGFILPVTRPPLFFYTDKQVESVVLNDTFDSTLLDWKRVPYACNDLFRDLSCFYTFKFDFQVDLLTKDHLLKHFLNFESCGFRVYMSDVDVCTVPRLFPFEVERILNLEEEEHYYLMCFLSNCAQSVNFCFDQECIDLAKKVPVLSLRRLFVFLAEKSEQRFIDYFAKINEFLMLDLNSDQDLLQVFRSSETANVKFATVTPSRIVYAFPKPMKSNRVLRNFGEQYFLKVTFRDDDGYKISTIRSQSADMDQIYERVQEVVSKGIILNSKKYEFLAMSSSQLRDHGCWFVTPFTQYVPSNMSQELTASYVDAEVIRAWLGDFSKITNIGKYVARLGQSLSSSVDVCEVEETGEVEDIQVTTDSVTYCFTDGIGKISSKRAREVAVNLNLDNLPSAFQIRYAGYKGVVAVDPTLQSPHLAFRPSMGKFTSGHKKLEVLNISQYIPCYLNRQVIMILSGLGVSDEVFFKYQRMMLDKMSRIVFDKSNSLSLLLRFYRPVADKKLFERSGLCFADDPFYHSLFTAIYNRQMQDVLNKSRVFIPRGRILLGVIDETGSLKENQVFVQCRRVPEDPMDNLIALAGEYLILNCSVVVAKNPCMHPGDIRKLRAVVAPLLSHMVDVIVFPAVGPRPISNMCSGSDLDGDLYFVTWEPDLNPPTEEPPMDYLSLQATTDNEIDVEQIGKFFVKFMKNDQMGIIANTHLAVVDKSEHGVRDPAAILLAQQFSLAVDFPKTGHVGTVPAGIKITEYPDFMCKYDRPSYQSQKIIGLMFRQCNEIFRKHTASPKIEIDSDLLVDGYKDFIEDAWKSYREYKAEYSRIMTLYNLRFEAEALLGMLDLHSVPKEEREEDVKRACEYVDKLRQHYRTLFFEKLNKGKHMEKFCKAAAWYFVAYTDQSFLSFPWIVEDLLLQVKQQKPDNSPLDMLGASMLQDFINDRDEVFLMELYELKDKLSSIIRVEGVQVLFTGCTSLLLLNRSSCVEFLLLFKDQELLEKDQVMLLQDLCNNILAPYFPLIEYVKTVNKPLIKVKGNINFTVTANASDYNVAVVYFKYIACKPEILVCLHILMKWADLTNYSKMNVDFRGRIEPFTLISYFIQFCISNFYIRQDEALQYMFNDRRDIVLFQSALEKLDCEEFQDLKLNPAKALLHFFADFNDNSQQQVFYRAFHQLSHLTRISLFWKHLSQVVPETSKQSLLHFKSNGLFFAENASMLLFNGTTSETDLIEFKPYLLPKKPQHSALPCYIPLLKNPITAASLYDLMPIYSARACAQLLKAKRYNSGTLHFTLKFGDFYLTKMPPMFTEEREVVTLEKTRLALEKGYSRVKDIEEPMEMSFKLEKYRLEDRAESLKEDATAQENNNEEQDASMMRTRKRAEISAMSSAFQPSIDIDSQVTTILHRLGFTSEIMNEAYLVSLELFNQARQVNQRFCVKYLKDLSLSSITLKSLRWLSLDIKANADIRFLLTSTQKLDISDCECLSMLKQGIIRLDPSRKSIYGCPDIFLSDYFKDNNTVHVRYSSGTRYKGNPQNWKDLLNGTNLFPSNFDYTRLSSISLYISSVTEKAHYSEQAFQYSNEKMELVAEIEIDRGAIDSVYCDDLLTGFFALAAVLQPFVKSTYK